MSDTLRIGDKVELTEGQKKVFTAEKKEVDNALTAFRVAGRWIERARDSMWDTFYEMRPELKGYEIGIDNNEDGFDLIITDTPD